MRTLTYSFILISFLFLAFNSSFAQTINTIVGDGTAGFTGDGSAAVAARVDHPKSIATDAAGNVYIADAYNNRIRKIDPAGIITTIAGVTAGGFGGDGLPATVANLDHPDYVITDPSGNIYISDADNQRIRKINTAGIINTIVGDGTAGYIGDGLAATAAEINFPTAIALDAAGNLYIADQGNNVIRKVNTAGIISTFAGTGATGYSGDGSPATATDMGFPYGLAVDGAGNVYVGLYFDNRIVKINTSGIVTTVAGTGTAGFIGDGGPATAAQLDGPWGIAVDITGNLYIADNNNYRIREVDGTGTINTIAGNGSSVFAGDGGPATAAALNDPIGVHVSATGDIYIPEYFVHRVRKINGSITTHPPAFAAGHVQTLIACENMPAGPIDPMLAITDPDVGQTETWSTLLPPSHGTLVASYSTTSTGSTLTPSGITYGPATGYVGYDTFKVRISDGTATDSIMVIVEVDPLPVAGTITGTDSVCPGQTITLSNATSGGFWSSSTTSIATVSPLGIVTGVATGASIISYLVTNTCGSASATLNVHVLPHSHCNAGVATIPDGEMQVYPNPGSGMFTVSMPASAYGQITVTNIMGQRVYETYTTFTKPVQIQLHQAPGIYFLNVVTAQGNWSRQIVIEAGQ